ncbi:hypothetical protein XI05_17710 [Bradyrhizobium sp. CCBAU 11357]|nr:hypothetical protein [Bradyrhizobium sp. CCBAU 11357]
MGLTCCSTGQARRAVDDAYTEAAIFEQSSTQAKDHFLFGQINTPFANKFVRLQEEVAIDDRIKATLSSDPLVRRIVLANLTQLPRPPIKDQIAYVSLISENGSDHNTCPRSSCSGRHPILIKLPCHYRFAFHFQEASEYPSHDCDFAWIAGANPNVIGGEILAVPILKNAF